MTMHCILRAAVLVLSAIAFNPVSAVADDNDGPRAFDVNKPAWFGGAVVQAFAVIPKPDGSVTPSPTRPDQTTYLVGNIFSGTPFGPQIAIPNAPVVIPAHDDVFTRWTPDGRADDVFGFWVVAATGTNTMDGDPSQNVRVRPMPVGSLAGAPLAYAVRLRDGWFALTSGAVIERALAEGLLLAIPSGPGGGFGGVAWLSPAVKIRDCISDCAER